jgi:hypothetical protein
MRALTRLVGAASVVGMAVLAGSIPAFASTTWGCTTSTCQVGVGTPGNTLTGSPTAHGAAGGASQGPCPGGKVVSYSIQTAGGQPVTAQPGDLNPITGAPVAPGSELEVISCNGSYLTTVVVPPRGPGGPGVTGVTGVQLARQAFSSFLVISPVPRFSPAQSVVGVATWLWLRQGWSSRSATASVPGLSATVMAEPSKVVWDMGDGGQTVCAGPGNAWDPHQPNATTDCSYTYPVAGHFTVTVTVYYATTWSASNGTAGQLAGITGRASVPVTVNEIQAVNNN